MSATDTVRRIFSMDKPSLRLLLKGLLCAALGTLMLPVPILLVWRIFAQYYTGEITSVPVASCMLGFASIMVYAVCMVMATVYSHKAAFGLSTSICISLMEHLGNVPLHWLSKKSNGELKKMMSHDVDQIEGFISHNLPDFAAAVILPCAVIPVLFFVSWQLALIMTGMVALSIAIQMRSMVVMQNHNMMNDYYGALNMLHGDAVEFIQGMPDIKIFNRTEDSFSRMQAAITKFKEIQTNVRKMFISSWAGFLTSLSMSFTILAAVGTYLYLRHGFPFENIVLFLVMGVVTFVPVTRLMRFVTFLWRAGMGYASVKTLMEAPVETPGTRSSTETVSADLTVSGLNVYYGDKQVLHDISFTAKTGTVTAIVGHSGSGKSTLAATIAGLEPMGSGRISVGGIALREFAPGELSRVMSFVYQTPFIFSGTVRENLCLGVTGATEEQIRQAAALVQCDTLIDSLPSGYDTRIGAGGEIHLSGGQKQRLALARMALRDAPVVLLDEATAFADPESEAEMQHGLSHFLSKKTVLVIAHRLPSIARADAILVLDNGRLVESGTHDALLAAGAHYARMWEAYHVARSWMITTQSGAAPQGGAYA